MLKQIIMLTKTIQIAAICFSMANPSNFYIEQPKKSYAENDFQLNIPYISSTSSNGTYEGNRVDYRKETGNAYNSALAVYAYRYIQTGRNGTQVTDPVILPTESTINMSRYTTAMYCMQIEPYKNIKNANTRTVLNMFLNNTIYVDPDTNENRLSLRYRLLTSTETYWATYMDISNYNTFGVNNDIYNNLTNAQNGFIYNEITKIKDFTTNPYNTTQTENFEVEIVTDKTNYIYILVEPYIRDYSSTPYVTIDGSQFWTNNRNNNLATVTGTEIISTVTQEVIDIPGIMFEVLTMPFTFISIAFNLTLFPGTPYQVNLSNLFLSILGIIIFVFILSKFIKKV